MGEGGSLLSQLQLGKGRLQTLTAMQGCQLLVWWLRSIIHAYVSTTLT